MALRPGETGQQLFDRVSIETYMHLMKHGLSEWTVGFDNAKRRYGVCYHERKHISFSRRYVIEAPDAEVTDTILHEVAHAIVGGSHGHDWVWKRKAVELGASPDRTSSFEVSEDDAPWVGTCPQCGATKYRYRKPSRLVSCGKCSQVFDLDLVFVWEFHGVEVVPSGRYAAALRSVASGAYNAFG